MKQVNRFDYPFPTVMYEPILKVRVGTEPGRDTEIHNVSIGIHNDPEITEGRYAHERSAEEQEILKTSPAMAALAARPIPFKSPLSVKLAKIRCFWEVADNVVRLKVEDDAASFLSYDKCEKIISLNLPYISANLFAFYKYVIENYIYLQGLERDYYSPERVRAADMVEICLNASAFFEAFGLSASDYEEVEPGWFALARKGLER